MKNRVFNAFLLLALVGVLFTACKKEYPQPPIQDLPIGTVYTIDEILAMESGTVFNEDASVYGIITADEKSGNLYKCAFMQDRATGAAIELYLDAPSGVRIGDSVRIYLKDVTYALYNNLPQLSNFEADGHIVILANNKPIVPAKTTIAEINQGRYLAGLVRLENVKFTEQNTFADPTTYGNRTLIDPSDPANSVIVRTSNYANFANDSLPQGTGNLVAIATVYNSTWQLVVRSVRELEFDGFDPGNDAGLPYYQDFSSSFGSYTTYDVAGAQSWEIDYSTAKITGYSNGTNYANEDWLISSPVALTGVDHVKVGVNYVAQYTNSNTEDVTLQISKDYVAGSDPQTATWKKMPVTYPNTGGWSDFQTVETSLDEFLGETVTVAIKFLSSETQSRTLEVKYILVEEGEPGGGGGGGGEPPTPGTGEGSGTADDPYNVAAGIGLQSEEPVAWVHGYIVGAVKSGLSSVTSNADVNWSAPFDLATNVVIADDASCREISQCVIVNLPAGKPLRIQVNLMDNPDNLGKHLAVLGKLRTYFGQPGLRDSGGTEADFVLDGGITPPDPGTTEYFNQTLTTQSSFSTFSAYSVTGEQEWYQNASHLEYGAVISGFANNVSYANEDWFISPVIDLSGSTNPILNFEHARGPEGSMNVGVDEGYYTVWVTNDYTVGEDPNLEQWVELPILNQPTTKWQFVAAGDLVIPAAFKTSTCRIAFRYLSVDGALATWEIKNVVVKEQ